MGLPLRQTDPKPGGHRAVGFLGKEVTVMKTAPALVLIVLIALLGWALPAGAEKAPLTDAQLDDVSAGCYAFSPVCVPGAPMVWLGARLFGGVAPVPNVPNVPNVPPVAPVGGKARTGAFAFGAMFGHPK